MLIKKLQFLQAKVITEFEAHWQMLIDTTWTEFTSK